MSELFKNIKDILAGLTEDQIEDNVFGIRCDDTRYQIGDICNNSHELYQDPDFDDDGELIYPYIEEGMYEGYYDAGELDGTCCVCFNPLSDESIQAAIKAVSVYGGNNIHIVMGESGREGNDAGELIIREAEVIGVFGK